MKSKVFSLLALFIGCIAALPAIAGSTYTPPPTAAPFDAGLSVLIAAGIGYASKKAYDKRKKNKMKEDYDK